MAKKRRSSRGRPTTVRNYPRTARLKQLFLEILADELEHIDDARLELVTVMDIEVDPDLNWAILYFIAPKRSDVDDATRDREVQDALYEYRVRLQGAIANQARVRRTPELRFEPDRVTESAARIESILRGLPELRDDSDSDEG